ncbi:MAG: hypothetical protein K6V36_14075 [Anaerolineae bacterium]|nr:hypothetical protein [Anaerolineae bacterium]
MSSKRVLAWAAIVFSAVLAIIVGNRMNAEAMAVVIGVVCGVAAGVPTSAIILALSRRSQSVQAEPRMPAAPPIYVVTAGPVPAVGPAWRESPETLPAAMASAPRQYRIIGDESC